MKKRPQMAALGWSARRGMGEELPIPNRVMISICLNLRTHIWRPADLTTNYRSSFRWGNNLATSRFFWQEVHKAVWPSIQFESCMHTGLVYETSFYNTAAGEMHCFSQTWSQSLGPCPFQAA